MKRLLKKTISKQAGAAASPKFPARKQLFTTASALTAATLSLVTGRPAEAFSIFPVDLGNYGDLVLNEELVVTDGDNNDALVNFVWTGDTGNFSVLRPSTVLTGGFNGGSTLEIQHDPASINEEVNLNITFANG
ncbi:MAG: hypothetical protein AAF959_08690, partial [Cyanobacteria bacterium P01_D01_bin.56]